MGAASCVLLEISSQLVRAILAREAADSSVTWNLEVEL